MSQSDRNQRVGVRLNEQEAKVVTEIAEETGLSVSDVIRQSVRSAHAERFKEASKRKKVTRG